MTNGEIAAVLTKIGEILDLQGENPFRVRAYERAATIIAALPRDLADIYKEAGMKGLLGLAGIGKDLGQKIEEMIKTGKLKYLKEIEKSIPKGLLEVTEIQGMGPKKTAFVWKKFGVTNIATLEKLANSGKLTKVKGWGAKSVENILKGIEIKRSSGGRMSIALALPIAEKIVTQLRETKLCVDLEIAGSLRRRRETIGDIDILVTSKKPAKIIDVFTTLPEVKRVVAKGTTRAAVVLSSGLNADLRVVPPEDFGAALYYFTGSKEHNVHVRGIAVRRGITVNEYGAYKGTAKDKGRKLASRTEEDLFKSIGIPFIPPELREDRGEVQAALKGELPDLITEQDLLGDLHVHSNFSDGNASMIDMANAALERGLTYIAMTDHASAMGMVKGIKEGNINEYLKKIGQARKEVQGFHILAGTEVDIEGDGSLYLPDKVLAKLDWIVAAVHGRFTMSREDMTKRLLKAIAHPRVNAIAHPTARLLTERPPISFDEDAVFRAAAKAGVALELNASIYRLDLNDVLCKRAKDLGVKIIISSDAHHPRELDYRFGISQARRGWLEKADVLNTAPWSEFMKYLKH